MTPRTRRSVCWGTIFGSIALGLLLLARAYTHWPASWTLVALGTLLGQTSLAALWCALGPGALSLRLPLAALWLAAIILAAGFNDAINSGSPDVDPVSSMGLMVLAQWVVIALPLWFLADWRRVRICEAVALTAAGAPNNRQIGIRGTMVITAAVAAVLGAASFPGEGAIVIKWEAVRELGFLALMGVTLALPLGIQALILRLRLNWQSVVAIALIFGLSTALDLLALRMFVTLGRLDAGFCWDLAQCNMVQTAWIFGTLTVLKLGGYEVARGGVVR